MNVDEVFDLVKSDYEDATKQFGSFVSAYDGLVILWKEFELLRDEMLFRENEEKIWAMQREAMQIAAMAIRFVVDSSP